MKKLSSYSLSLLLEAISGNPLDEIKDFPEAIERPWKFWYSNEVKWAVYLFNGDYWPKTLERAIKEINKGQTAKPCVIASKNIGIELIAEHFIELEFSVITEIGGKGMLIDPPVSPKNANGKIKKYTRIPLKLIEECAKINKINCQLQKLISDLAHQYRKNEKDWTDDQEHKCLESFFLSYTAQNGLREKPFKAQEILLRLEKTEMKGIREHYFHSFQNFFLGLWAIGETSEYFKKWANLSKLNWNLSPEFIWFLITIWHDVGYCQKILNDIESDVIGIERYDVAEERRVSYITHPLVQEGKRYICSLIEHLSKKEAGTAWTFPPINGIRSKTEQELEEAMCKDFHEGHGSYSAMRLYTDMKRFIDECGEQKKRNLLHQATLLASASIPFHDWRFREFVREKCGTCRIPALTMPFAVLLAFIDSIQEDRRSLVDIQFYKPFLRRLFLKDGRKILADVDTGALTNKDVIWKMIEARDVLAAVEFCSDSFEVMYPEWITT